MGGKGSGGHNRLSDEEKKRRGTFKESASEKVYDERAERKIITGPWISKVPEPDFPLDKIARAKYQELATMLLENGTLTAISAMQCAQVAILLQNQRNLLSTGKIPPVSLSSKVSGLMAQLRISENAKPIGEKPKKNRFDGSGFSNSRSTPFRLRASASSDPGKL